MMRIVDTLCRHGRPMVIALSVGIGASIGVSFAQTANGPGEAQAGRMIASVFCVGCHQIEPAATGPVNADVPTFQSIANRPDITEDRIANFITDPHPPMPRLDLNRQQIADLVSFILSHRDRDTGG